MKASNAAALALLRLRGADGVTPAEARSAIACDRLAARVCELKAFGFDIQTVRERTPMGSLVARYYLRERRTFAPVEGVQKEMFG